jgi:Undecaprenyl-phosphate glucose phosphotransferase
MFPDELSAKAIRQLVMNEPLAKSAQAELDISRLPAPQLSSEAREVAERMRRPTISPSIFTGIARVGDAVLVATTGSVTLLATSAGGGVPLLSVLAIIVAVASLTLICQALDCYQVRTIRTIVQHLLRMGGALAIIFGAFTLLRIAGNFGIRIADAWLAFWALGLAASLLVWRLSLTLAARRLTATGRLGHRAVLVAGDESASKLIKRIEGQHGHPTRVCGIFDDRATSRTPSVKDCPTLGSIADLIEFARIAHVDMVIVAIPISAEDRLLHVMKQLWVLPVDIRLAAHTDGWDFRDRPTSMASVMPFVDVIEKPVADWDAIAKRAIDLLFASVALILLAPVMIATAIAIRLDSPGPIFFRQKRYGFNNEVIEVLKFRSMYHHMADPHAKQVVRKGDSRVTRVGRFIRKTSIDELPQLLNVLTGELSMVGPRPHAVNAHTDERLWEEVVEGYFARHKVKPGITGWAQINGWRGEVDTPEKIHKRVECDIYYIENWSLLFDIYIMLRTPFALLDTKNAY